MAIHNASAGIDPHTFAMSEVGHPDAPQAHDPPARYPAWTALRIDPRSGLPFPTEELVAAAVKVARSAGLSWDRIGEVLGVSQAVASARYSSLTGEADSPPAGEQRTNFVGRNAADELAE